MMTAPAGEELGVEHGQPVDLDGEPLLVVAGWTRDAPPSVVDELRTMADSIELHPRQLPWR